MAERTIEILVSLSGLDETMGQVVHARWSYLPHEIRVGHRFVDVLGRDADGRYVDYRKFHDTVAVAG